MRILLLFFLFVYSSFALCDTFEVVEDHNYEAQRSNSEDYANKYQRAVTIENKTYFSVVVDGGEVQNSFTRLSEKRLAVTDGTSAGTHYVKGLENTNMEGRLLGFKAVGSTLLIILRNIDNSSIEFWKLTSETDEAVLIQEIPRYGDLAYFYNGVQIDGYKEGKAVITAQLSRSIIIYNSTDESIEIINMGELSEGGSHNVSEVRFVSGEHLYYQVTISWSEYEIYRLHLLNKEIELVTNSRIGWGHTTIGDHIYFLRQDEPGKYAVYSINASNRTLIKEYGLVNYYPSITPAFSLIDGFIVLNSLDPLIIKKNESSSFFKLPLPENVFMERRNTELSLNTYSINGKYYIPAKNMESQAFVILETDFQTYVNVELEFNHSDETQSGNVKYTAVNDNMIYLVSDTDSPVSDYYVGYGTARGYRWDPATGGLTLVWEKDNYNGVSPITNDRKKIVFAYTVEMGSEPWNLDFATGSSEQLADFNTDFRTRDSNFKLFKSSKTRALFTFASLPFRKAVDYFSLTNGQLKGYIKPESNPDPKYPDVFIGMDGRYDYFLAFTPLQQTVVSGYDSYNGSIVELAAFRLSGLVDNSDLSKARISFVIRDGTYVDSPKFVYQWSIDGERKFEVSHVYTEIIALDNHLLLTGWNYEKGQQQYGIFKDTKEIATFFIECEEQVSCGRIARDVFNESEHLIIATDASFPADRGNFNKVYYINLEKGSSPKSIPLESFLYSSYPRESPILAVENEGILFVKDGFNGELIKYLPEENSFEEYSFVGKTGRYSFLKTGNYYVGVSTGAHDSGEIFVFDKKLNLINRKSKRNILLALGYDTNYASISDYLGCAYGACYVQGNNSFGERAGLFQIKFDVSLNNFQVVQEEINLLKSIWTLKDVIFSAGQTAEFGVELYQHVTSGIDSDGDGMWDGYELAYDFDPANSSDGEEDLDNDGLTNLQEFNHGTDPTNPNTDGDEIRDGIEVSLGYDPREYDTHFHDEDGDGLSFRQEYEFGTDYLNADTDHDGYIDSNDEFPLDPSESKDNDGDGIGDNSDQDDDNDGMPDEWEERYNLDPFDDADRDTDLDNDGISNYQEYVNGTNPTVANSSSGGGNDNPPSSDSGGGGSTPIWLLFLLLAFSVNRFYKAH